MSIRRVISTLVLFLIVLVGQSILMSDQTQACCNIYLPTCNNWTGLVYGTLQLDAAGPAALNSGGKAKVSVESGASAVLDVSQEVIDDFKAEQIKSDFGFIILEAGTRKVIGFVPADRMNHQPSADKKVNAQTAVKEENRLFTEFATGSKK